MKKVLVRIIAAALVFVCALAPLTIAAAAYSEEEYPIIFVDGIVSSDILNAQTGETVFPPSAQSVISGVSKAVLPLASSLADKDYSRLAQPLGDALKTIFADALTDENGDPVIETITEFSYPEAMDDVTADMLEKVNIAPENVYRFSYDWRLDMQLVASQLHDYIEYILDFTGAEKVNLIGFSLGTCVTMTYLNDYDYDYVAGVVLLAGGYNGVSTCGEPFAGKIDFDSEATARFIGTLLGDDFMGKVVKGVISALYGAGAFDAIIGSVSDISDAILDELYEQTMKTTFAMMPGLWALVPGELYDEAKALMLTDSAVSDEFIAKIDYYHDNIQSRNAQIIDSALARNINFGIVAKYGSAIPPVVESMNNIGDLVIDLKYESFGATCAQADERFGEDYVQAVDCGHSHLSPDLMVDASTCAYPEYTWFIKGLLHAEHIEDEFELCKFILYSDSQVDVHTNAEYPQFLVNSGDALTAMTAENSSDGYGKLEKKEGFITRLFELLATLLAKLLRLFGII